MQGLLLISILLAAPPALTNTTNTGSPSSDSPPSCLSACLPPFLQPALLPASLISPPPPWLQDPARVAGGRAGRQAAASASEGRRGGSGGGGGGSRQQWRPAGKQAQLGTRSRRLILAGDQESVARPSHPSPGLGAPQDTSPSSAFLFHLLLSIFLPLSSPSSPSLHLACPLLGSLGLSAPHLLQPLHSSASPWPLPIPSMLFPWGLRA